MTPTSIKTGRELSSVVSLAEITDGDTTAILPADAARVAVAVALCATGFTGDALMPIGVKVGGQFVPLTSLTVGHPACYLSVDKIGTLVLQELWAQNLTGSDQALGITTVRQLREF